MHITRYQTHPVPSTFGHCLDEDSLYLTSECIKIELLIIHLVCLYSWMWFSPYPIHCLFSNDGLSKSMWCLFWSSYYGPIKRWTMSVLTLNPWSLIIFSTPAGSSKFCTQFLIMCCTVNQTLRCKCMANHALQPKLDHKLRQCFWNTDLYISETSLNWNYWPAWSNIKSSTVVKHHCDRTSFISKREISYRLRIYKDRNSLWKKSYILWK